ncbi:acylphosphatase [Macrococcus equipercicus]|uniref:acylphosphatase n=1 Tax=Macrococcus equipercicus TaxID=69967 RepID=A0A9Q9F2G6_9STAP|nr:acylphosphatase [Macrococcus equipercicus]KAA1040246.1 acylphosphatase [Macrococcus equipercicus]UTH12809.1 acylphosphatase [Macrococcus equipercicus]
MITEHIKVYGRVQGVGFRNATAKLAAKYDITGTVQNVEDFVEVFVSGKSDEVKAFAAKVITGPASFSRVRSYEIFEIPYREYDSFKQI